MMANLDISRAQHREAKIKLHGAEAFKGMRKAGQLAARALDMLVEHVKPGVTTEHLDDIVVDFAVKQGAIPAPLNSSRCPVVVRYRKLCPLLLRTRWLSMYSRARPNIWGETS